MAQSNNYPSPSHYPLAMQEFLNSPLAQTITSPGGDFQFADLLAEFKDSNQQAGGINHISPDQGSSNSSGGENLYDRNSRSPEELLLDHYGVSPITEGSNEFEYSQPNQNSREITAPANQLVQAIASMDPSTQSQLLAALLAQSAGAENHQLSQQPLFQQAELVRTSYPSGTRSHPQSRSSSAHPSPHSQLIYNPSNNPPALNLPNQYSKYSGSRPHDNSLPTTNVSSPLASPFPTNHQTNPCFPPTPGPQAPILLAQIQQQQQGYAGRNAPTALETSSINTSMEMNGGMGAMRGGSATGGSYATTNDDQEWAENDFIFSPLMSPALTPHSAFSSHPPSASSLPNSQALNSIVPAELFSPLGSPAIMPHRFRSESNTNWQQVQGLVDQTQALGFEGSPNYGIIQQSPRMLPVNDGGSSTAAGSGRRGAGARKTRPSPLLKPTPDGALQRRGKKEKIGSRSTTTSPFLGPTFGMSGINQPIENLDIDGSINTPSPVDLAMNTESYNQLPNHLIDPQLSFDSNYLMGPPPLPIYPRRTSSGSLLGQDAATDWLKNPVTPATFMNSNYNYSTLPPAAEHMIASGSNVTYPAVTPTMSARGKKAKAEESSTVEVVTVKGKGKAVKKTAKAKAKASANDDGDHPASTSDNRRTSHKAAEQKRRDSLKTCFEELRRILPPLSQHALIEEERRPGEGNVGGQRGGSVDPENPNKGVSKVALLRRSNEYIEILHERVNKRNFAISKLKDLLLHFNNNLNLEEIIGLDLENLDFGERPAGTMASYEYLESDNEEETHPTTTKIVKKKVAANKKKQLQDDNNFDPEGNGVGQKVTTRSSRRNSTVVDGGEGIEMDEEV